jgi:putative transposase
VPGPVPRPPDWLKWVNQPLTVGDLEGLRKCVQRGRPFGDAPWVEQTAKSLHLESSLRPRGGPRKAK